MAFRKGRTPFGAVETFPLKIGLSDTMAVMIARMIGFITVVNIETHTGGLPHTEIQLIKTLARGFGRRPRPHAEKEVTRILPLHGQTAGKGGIEDGDFWGVPLKGCISGFMLYSY